MPNCEPSTSRVDALTRTAAASTSRVKRRAWPRSLVTIASARPVPWRWMCVIAASRSSTTRTARIRSRYSVSQSASVAGRVDGTSARVRGQPRTSTPASARRAARAGRSRGAISRCTRRVSRALQTPGRCAFAFTTIWAAIAGSAAAQTPRVARFDAEARGAGGDVGPRLVDEPDDTQRDANAGDLDAVRPPPHLHDRPDGVRERGDLPEPLRHLLEAALGQRETVEERPRRAPALRPLDVGPVRLEERPGFLDESVGHLHECVVLDLRRAERQRARGVAGGAGLGLHEVADVHGSLLEEHEVVAGDHFVEAPVPQPPLDLRRLRPPDLPHFVGVEVHHAPRELPAGRAPEERHHVARGKLPPDLEDARPQEARAPPG